MSRPASGLVGSGRLGRGRLLIAVPLALAFAVPPQAATQEVELRIEFVDGTGSQVPISFRTGPTAVPLSTFTTLGWSATGFQGGVTLEGPDGTLVALDFGSPFLKWNDDVVHLTDAPFSTPDEAWVPLQLVSEVLVERLGAYYDFEAATLTLEATTPQSWGGVAAESPRSQENRAGAGVSPGRAAVVEAVPSAGGAGSGGAPDGGRPGLSPTELEGPPVVIIDPGHGGGDPGALGLGGVREKDIALAVGRELARILEEDGRVEVRMTRSTDRFVPIWERGELATGWKGDRPGIFVSLHANSLPSVRSLRGFETYFLAESRTDHEARLTAIENAPLAIRGQEFDPQAMPEIDHILRDLRAHGLENWSSLLAELVQEEMGSFHPGPDRGVRQGVLAVLTNALMPSVLVEVGYLSNADEALVLVQPEFQEEAAAAVARAVISFFGRYPPGSPSLKEVDRGGPGR